MAQPTYVNRHGLPVYPQPVACVGMTMHVFMMASSDESALQALVDAQLNMPMGQAGRFRVLAPLVTLSIAQIDSVGSEVPPFNDRGALTEKEATFWIPILDTLATGPQPLSFMIPYIFVGNPLALAAGRELEGFPKDPAAVTVPPDAEVPSDLSVDAMTVVTFGRGATVTQARLVDVSAPATPGDALVTDRRAALEAVREVVGQLGAIGRNLHEAMALLHTLEGHYLETILLKQMRDVANGLLACYQAVVRVPLVVTRFESLRLHAPHVVTLMSTDSHPLMSTLGLQSSQPSLGALTLRFDAQVPNGEVLWQA